MDAKTFSRLRAQVLTQERRKSEENALEGGREMSIITQFPLQCCHRLRLLPGMDWPWGSAPDLGRAADFP